MFSLRYVILAFAAVASVLTARATVFNVNGIDYDITMQTLTWNQPIDQAILTSTAWYGNEQLAVDIAGVVQNSLGVQTSWYNTGFGVYFVYGGVPSAAVWGGSVATTNLDGVNYLPMKYAVGSAISQVPDNGLTIALLGLSALGLAAARRKLRA